MSYLLWGSLSPPPVRQPYHLAGGAGPPGADRRLPQGAPVGSEALERWGTERADGGGMANDPASGDVHHGGDGRSRVGSEPGRPPGLRARVPAMLARTPAYLYLVGLGLGLVLDRPVRLAIGH